MIILSAILVALPTALLLMSKGINKSGGIILRIIYALMLLATGWILLFDSTYGPWWEIMFLTLSCIAIVKSIYVTTQIQKA